MQDDLLDPQQTGGNYYGHHSHTVTAPEPMCKQAGQANDHASAQDP